ncbi:unnamed protein product [Penicillium roqueforti FM164]|uniref:Uncharacterized protein n=1 Tax=Penicillium roqueforti (strain FM164) TaxID=1365484 RepID=W6QJF8_PENRF|nr:unnamed protein product [Penicillium roqueforti FM164]
MVDFNDTEPLLSLAFPTLFPRGAADAGFYVNWQIDRPNITIEELQDMFSELGSPIGESATWVQAIMKSDGWCIYWMLFIFE